MRAGSLKGVLKDMFGLVIVDQVSYRAQESPVAGRCPGPHGIVGMEVKGIQEE